MTDASKTTYGSLNPHPLSQMRTELVWEGKYDEFGNRREMDIANYSLPLQLIETIDESRSRAQAQGSLFDNEVAHRDDFRNRLIWGDNKLVIASLLEQFKGSLDMIYIDPPFDVGADFTMDIAIGNGPQTLSKDQSIMEMVAYRDMWGKGVDSYLHILNERLVLMKDLLSDKGTIFVHCDYHMSHLIRALIDDIFSKSNFMAPPRFVWVEARSLSPRRPRREGRRAMSADGSVCPRSSTRS